MTTWSFAQVAWGLKITPLRRQWRPNQYTFLFFDRSQIDLDLVMLLMYKSQLKKYSLVDCFLFFFVCLFVFVLFLFFLGFFGGFFCFCFFLGGGGGLFDCFVFFFCFFFNEIYGRDEVSPLSD